ncbi:MAG: class I adenylate-forming enzyme family protein, partial [Caldimonas sp.]
MGKDIAGWIEFWAQRQPERIALHFDGRDISYRALLARIRVLVAHLGQCGVSPGDRIGYLGANHPEMVALTFACARTGAIFVPLNWRLSAPELAAILRDCKPAMLICEPEFADTGATIASGGDTVIAPLQTRADVWYDCAWPAALQRAAPAPKGPPSEGLVLLMYTSGTTGFPKGAAHTQEGMEWNAKNAIHGYELSSGDNVLANLPLFHVGGLTMLTLPALKAGATVTLHRRFDAALTIRDIATRRITMLLAVATTLKAMFEHPLWPSADTSSLRLVMTGASIIPQELLRPFFERGVVASQVFGATEMGIGACLPPQDALRKIGSVGRAARHRTMRLLAPDGSVAGAGEVGEIVVGGPGLMTRYWGDPAGTAACLEDGWFRTGDLGTCDSDGYYTILGRKKEMIISGGENIYPAEIENVLTACPEIAEAAVVGRPDDRWGEVPVAFVVKQPGCEISADAVRALLQSN